MDDLYCARSAIALVEVGDEAHKAILYKDAPPKAVDRVAVLKRKLKINFYYYELTNFNKG